MLPPFLEIPFGEKGGSILGGHAEMVGYFLKNGMYRNSGTAVMVI